MIIPIRCFTCGKVIADKWDYYIKEVEKLKGKKGASDGPTGTGLDKFDSCKTGPILDRMGLTRQCCRRHMIAHVELVPII